MPPIDEDLLEYSEFPPRLIGILKGNNIARVSQLASMSDEDILLLRNIGPDSLVIIRRHASRQ